MVALRMANVGFLPGLFGMTDWPASGSERTAVIPRKAKRLPRAFAERFARLATGCLLIIDPLRIRIRLRLVALVALAVLRLVLLRLVIILLDPLRLLLRQRGAQLEVASPVEERLAVDERRLHTRIGRERVAVPDGEVSVLAGVDGAETVIEAKLPGGIQRAELQRLLFRQSAVLHGLGGVEVEAAGQLGIVGVDRGQHAAAHHQGHVVWDGVTGFGLEPPPVDERTPTRAVSGDLLGHLVAFEHVLELADLEAL